MASRSKLPSLTVSCLALSMLAIGWTAGAVTVHTWVDAEGVRHYADNPPAASTGTDEIELVEPAQASGEQADDYYSITNQWERLRAERDLEAERKIERERIRSQERAQRNASVGAPPTYQGRSFAGYFPYGGGFGYGRPPNGYYGDGSGAGVDRRDYVNQRRQRGFSPTPAPVWPRQR